MAEGHEVLQMLCPEVGWVIYGNDYNSINWFDKSPAITQEEFEAGFAQIDAWKVQQDAEKSATRQALLDKLGITEEEAKLLLGYN